MRGDTLLSKFRDIYEKYYNYTASKASNRADFQNYFTLNLLISFASLPHLFYIFYFYAIGIYPMVIFNICSVLCYVFSFGLVEKNNFLKAQTVITIEVYSFSLFGTFLFGNGLDFNLYLAAILLPNALIFTINKKRLLGLSILAYLLFIAYTLSDIFWTPLYTLETSFVIKMINIHVVICALFVELYLILHAKKSADRFYMEKMDKLKQETYLDPLTLLHNRRFADIFFKKFILNNIEHNMACFAMIDIDCFKSINDKYGHDAGDIVLKNLSLILKKSFRINDLICRWGGEEFLIVLLDASLKDTVVMLEKLRKNIENLKMDIGDDVITCTITIGVSKLIEKDVQSTIIKCDEYLYKGKTSGKNKVVSH